LALALLGLACRERRTAAPTPRAAAAPGNRHNVLLVTIDTLRADHLGTYGAGPRARGSDASRGRHRFRRRTIWPRARSFVMMMTGRRPSRNGYSKTHPVLLDFNPTLASVLKDAGYRTAAIVDNPNVAAQNGYAKGFDSYREVWEEKPGAAEVDLMRAITDGGVEFLRAASPDRPFYQRPRGPVATHPRRSTPPSATQARPAVRA
jgi:arylsulfatase A-like enzyme